MATNSKRKQRQKLKESVRKERARKAELENTLERGEGVEEKIKPTKELFS